MITFHEEIPTVQAYNKLRISAGWGALDTEAVEQALPNSVYGVIAKEEDHTIAFARVIGDGKLCFYIQEIIVHPEYQRQGIATRLMEYIMAFLKENAIQRSYIGVFVGKGLEAFYKRYGFWQRPNDVMGPGMMQFWNDKIYDAHYKGDN